MRFRRRARSFGAAVRPPLGYTLYLPMIFIIAIISFELGDCGDSRDARGDPAVPTVVVSTPEEAVVLLEGRLMRPPSLTRHLGVLESAVCGAVPGWPEFRMARFKPASRSWIVPCELRFMQRDGSPPSGDQFFFAVDSDDGSVHMLNLSGENRPLTR